MKIWEIVSVDQSMVVIPHDFEKDANRLDNFVGKPLADSWETVKLDVYRKGKHKDFPHLINGVLILTKKSLDVLKSVLEDYAEFLPAENDEYEMTMINITKMIDCVDYERSVPDKVPSGKIVGFDKLFFVQERIMNILVFKIPEKPSKIFVSDEFRDLVIKSKLKGLEFNLVWDSEITEDRELAQEQKFESILEDIERNKGQEFNWNEAIEKVKIGRAMVSGKWKLQAEADGNVLTGQLQGDGTYSWVDPVFYPPILLDLKWHEVEKSEI